MIIDKHGGHWLRLLERIVGSVLSGRPFASDNARRLRLIGLIVVIGEVFRHGAALEQERRLTV